MKIQCPKCKSIFQIDVNTLPSNENRFRCYKCGYIWILDIINYRKFNSEKSQTIKHKVTNKNTVNFQSPNYLLFLTVSSIVLFVIISFLLISNRTNLAKGLKKLSFPVMNSKRISKTDLDIEIDIPIPTIRRDDKDFLMIKGRVINRTHKKQFVPPILIELKNREKNILWHISKKFHKEYILPKSSETFTFMVEKYSKTIANANIRFSTHKD